MIIQILQQGPLAISNCIKLNLIDSLMTFTKIGLFTQQSWEGYAFGMNFTWFWSQECYSDHMNLDFSWAWVKLNSFAQWIWSYSKSWWKKLISKWMELFFPLWKFRSPQAVCNAWEHSDPGLHYWHLICSWDYIDIGLQLKMEWLTKMKPNN